MNNPNIDQSADRSREAQQALDELMRQAKEQGIKPFSSVEEWSGGEEIANDPNIDVDEFLKDLRASRNYRSDRSIS
jgi:hypothetical protein